MWVPDPLYLKALHNPNQVALSCPDRQWTFQEFELEVCRVVARCGQCQIGAGDRVGILAENSPGYIFWLIGLSRIATVIVFLNTRLTPPDLARQLVASHAKILLYDDRHLSVANALQQQIPLLTLPITSNCLESASLPPILNLSPLHSIFFTSGTTGQPKGAMLSLQNHYASAIGVLQHLTIGAYSHLSWLICLPLFHVGGSAVVWRSLIGGFALWLLPRFEEETVLHAVASGTVGYISLVPTMLHRLLQHPQFPENLFYWQKLQAIVIGGASLTLGLQEQCQALQLPIVLSYGLTEAASQVTTLLRHEYSYKNGSSGRTLPGMKLEITNRQAGVGEIIIQGPQVIANYLDCPPHQGWFATGDIGYLDEDGYLYVLDRRSDLIISGGENIYPAEVEAVLSQHPDIIEVCVIGVDNIQWGAVVASVYRSSRTISLAEIQQFCEEKHLPRYKMPRVVYQVEELPKSASGKISRSGVIYFLRSLKQQNK